MKNWLKISLVSIALIIGLGIALFDGILESILKNKLESLLNLQEDRIYDYSFDDLSLKFISGNLVLTDVKITPRKKILDSLMNHGIQKREVYSIELKELRIEGIESWRFIRKTELYIRSISFDHPLVKIYKNNDIHNINEPALASEIIAPTLTFVHIKEFKLVNGGFTIYDTRKPDSSASMSFDSANIAFLNLHSDSMMIKEGQYLSYEEIYFSMKNIDITSMEHYRFKIASVQNNFAERNLKFKKLELSPRLDKYEFMKTKSHQSDWFNINLDEIEIHKLDVSLLQKTGKIDLNSLAIKGGDLELYRDKRMPPPPSKYKSLPSKFLREFSTSISIENIEIKETDIRYLEWEKNAAQPIVVKFEKTSANISNFTSDDEKLRENDTVVFICDSKFMNHGDLHIELKTPVLDSTDIFEVYGRIENLPLSAMNPILQHSAFVKFEEGLLNFMEFEITADDDYSRGILNLDYSNLKRMQVVRNKTELDLQKDKKGHHKDQKKFISFLANTIIPSEYNEKSKNYFPGQIAYKREKDKAIFGYLVKSVQSGVITCIMPSKQENYSELKRTKKLNLKELKKEEKHKAK